MYHKNLKRSIKIRKSHLPYNINAIYNMYKVLIKYAYLYILYPTSPPYRFFLNPDSQEENDGVVGARGRKKRLMFPPFLSDKRGKTKIRVASPCKRGQGQGRRGPGFPSVGSSQRSSARGASAGSRGGERSASKLLIGGRGGEGGALRARTRISWTGFPPDFSCFTISAPEGH